MTKEKKIYRKISREIPSFRPFDILESALLSNVKLYAYTSACFSPVDSMPKPLTLNKINTLTFLSERFFEVSHEALVKIVHNERNDFGVKNISKLKGKDDYIVSLYPTNQILLLDDNSDSRGFPYEEIDPFFFVPTPYKIEDLYICIDDLKNLQIISYRYKAPVSSQAEDLFISLAKTNADPMSSSSNHAKNHANYKETKSDDKLRALHEAAIHELIQAIEEDSLAEMIPVNSKLSKFLAESSGKFKYSKLANKIYIKDAFYFGQADLFKEDTISEKLSLIKKKFQK